MQPQQEEQQGVDDGVVRHWVDIITLSNLQAAGSMPQLHLFTLTAGPMPQLQNHVNWLHQSRLLTLCPLQTSKSHPTV